MPLHDAAVNVPLVTIDQDAYLASFASPIFYDSDNITPIVRTVRTSISIAGAAGALLIQFNVLNGLNVPLPIIFNVLNGGLNASLPIVFNVTSQSISLPIIFNVIPNLIPSFSEDIQQPTAEVEETP